MLIALIITSLLALFFFIKGLRLAIKLNELRNFVIVQEAKINANSDPVKEDFLRFISESREWAFEYIEEVQKAINDFKINVESHINFFDRFGDVLSNQRPDYEALKTISTAYKELIAVLPGEDNATTKN
jgi:hypothetical protein